MGETGSGGHYAPDTRLRLRALNWTFTGGRCGRVAPAAAPSLAYYAPYTRGGLDINICGVVGAEAVSYAAGLIRHSLWDYAEMPRNTGSPHYRASRSDRTFWTAHERSCRPRYTSSLIRRAFPNSLGKLRLSPGVRTGTFKKCR